MKRYTVAVTLFGLAACLLVASSALAAEATIPAEGSCRQLICQGKAADAEKQCLIALRSRGLLAEIRWRYVVDMARCQRLQNQAAAALDTLKQLSPRDRERSEVRIEAAYCFVAAGNVPDATSLLNLVDGDKNPVNQVAVDLLRGRMFYTGKRYTDCIQACDKVIATHVHALASNIYKEAPIYEGDSRAADIAELNAGSDEARKLAAQAKDAMVLAAYGQDYAIYRQARQAQSRGDFADASTLYQSIKAPVLADAARCYIAACTAEASSPALAIRQYQQGLKMSVSHLYDAEALVELARLSYIQANSVAQVKQARQYLQQARGVLYQPTYVQDAKTAMAGFAPVLKQFPAEKDFNGPSSLGTYYEMLASPEAIINELTTAWYVPRLKVEVELLDCLLATEAGDKAGAMQALQAIQKINGAGNSNFLRGASTLNRLCWDMQQGAFLVPPEAWASSPLPLRLACFNYVAGKTQQARKLFDAVPAEQVSPLARSVVQLGTAYCQFKEGHDDEVEKIVAEMVQHQPNMVDLEGVLLLSNIYAGQPNKYDQAIKGYSVVIEKAPKTPLAAQALMAMAVSAVNHGDRETATKACQLLTAKGGHQLKYYTVPASVLQDKLSRLPKQAKSIMPEPDQGTSIKPRVVLASKHITFPAGGDGPNLAGISPDSLARCDLSYSTISSCIHVSNFTLRVSEFEPQIEPTNEDHLIFLRSPSLFRELPLEAVKKER